ncbi:MAG: hypothetical protein QFX37_01805 [Archaeoglobales archaeon]|nr:hypothetical protein [Archaeoglobales archaeon]
MKRVCRLLGILLLDEIFEEMIWFVSPEKVRETIKNWFERC